MVGIGDASTRPSTREFGDGCTHFDSRGIFLLTNRFGECTLTFHLGETAIHESNRESQIDAEDVER